MTEPCVSFVDVMNTIAVVENALLQYWQIHSLDATLTIDGRSRASLVRTQTELARGIEESAASAISYGSAQEISAKILRHLHADLLQRRLVDRLGVMQQLLDSEQIQASTRRNFILAGMGSLATVLLGIPALKESLEVVAEWRAPDSLSPIANPIIEWAKGGPSAALAAYATVVGTAILLLLLGFLLKKPRRSQIKKKEVGIAWTPFSPKWSLQSSRYVAGRLEERDVREGEVGSGPAPAE